MSKWYKVLDETGRSFHGGDMKWSLPTSEGPGEWHGVDGELRICYNGLHVTNDPAHWMRVGAKVYHAECEECGGQDNDKAVFRRVRLTAELTTNELRELRIAGDGDLSVTMGLAFAFGSCTVRASGSATVRAWGSATVDAWGSATVNICGVKCKVDEKGNAVVIDRTKSPPEIRTGWKKEVSHAD